MHNKIDQHEKTNNHIRELFKFYQILKKNDFDVKIRNYKKKKTDNGEQFGENWYMELHTEIEKEIA